MRDGVALIKVWLERRRLVSSLTRRTVLMRYRGSLLGFLWSVLTPLLLLCVYSVVFGLIFRTRWPHMEEWGLSGLAIMLFCGMVPFNFLNEALTSSCQSLVLAPNYIKKVVFPTEILPLVSVLSALVHAAISTAVLAAWIFAVQGSLPLTWLLVPVIWLPLLVFAAGMSLFLAGSSVFIRDVSHVVGIVLLVVMFATPIFYPDNMVPPRLQILMFINPLANLVTNMRKVCVLGLPVNWLSWAALLVMSLGVYVAAAAWFNRVRRRFADVL